MDAPSPCQGKPKSWRKFGLPFQGESNLDIHSEGDALGYDGSGHWPEGAKVNLKGYSPPNPPGI